MSRPEILYRNGLAMLRHVREAPPFMEYDERCDAFVAPATVSRSCARGRSSAASWRATPRPPRRARHSSNPRTPRDYQQDAVDRWLASDGRGCVVLPTGSGKSFVAVLAIHATCARACVVAPTRALVSQWYGQLADAFGAERVRAWYGDEKNLAPITWRACLVPKSCGSRTSRGWGRSWRR